MKKEHKKNMKNKFTKISVQLVAQDANILDVNDEVYFDRGCRCVEICIDGKSLYIKWMLWKLKVLRTLHF